MTRFKLHTFYYFLSFIIKERKQF